MARFNYAKMQAVANRLIDRFGTDATLTRRVTGGTRMNPTSTERVEAVVIIDNDIRTEFANEGLPVQEQGVGGLALTETQRIVTVSAAAPFAPEVGDTLTVDGDTLAVVQAKPYKPGPVVMFYSITVDARS